MGNGVRGQLPPKHWCRSYTSGRLQAQRLGDFATSRISSVWYLECYSDTDLVQGKIRSVPGGEVRLSVDAVADVLSFGTSILPLEIMREPVNGADGEPRERFLGFLMLTANCTIVMRTRESLCQILHSLRAWMYRDHCFSFLIRSAMLRRGGATG